MKKLIFLILIIIIPVVAFSMGQREDAVAYRNELNSVFDDTVAGIYTCEITLFQGKEALKKLRANYNIGYTDESGVIDSMLDRVYEGTMSPKETKYYFDLLKENRLSEYRTESYQKQFSLHQKELLNLMLSMIRQNTSNITASELRNTINNYYDFLGLRFGQEYQALINLLIQLEEGKISVKTLQSGLAIMEKEVSDKITAYALSGRNEAENSVNTAAGTSFHADGGSAGGDNSSGQNTGSSAGSGSGGRNSAGK